MSGDPRAAARAEPNAGFRGFRRARRWLWAASLLAIVVGAALHDRAERSLGGRLLWLASAVLCIAAPLRALLAFRCPRCRSVFLTTGRWSDFLGLGRIFWAERCGHCGLELPDDGPPSSGELPESRPV